MNRIRIILFTAFLTVVSACGCTGKHILPTPPETFERYTETIEMHSDILNTTIYFGVYLPASYRDDKSVTYPVVYMLHGYGDNWKSWNGKYLHANSKINALEAQGLSEMIYVFPVGFTSYYCNYYNGKYNYMDMFTEELIPYIDKSFRTKADKQHRSITGYSMGGFGAMVLAEKHPELFCCSAPLSMSFRTNKQYMTESQSGWDSQWGAIFGGVGQSGANRLTDYYIDHCPFYQFNDANRKELESVNWFFTCGDDEEQLLVANDSLHTILRDRNYAHEFRVGNGAHTSSYWMDALNEVLPWFDHCMNGSDRWPICSYMEYQKADITLDTDKAAVSPAYDGEGTGIFFFHEGLSDAEIKDAMATAWSTSTTARFMFLPCDLDRKGVQEWENYYSEKYGINKKVAVVLRGNADSVMDRKAEYASILLVNASCSVSSTKEGERFYFAATDDVGCYKSMDDLYRSCKRSGATFEYRVINGSGNIADDMLRALSRIKSYITY